LEPSSTTRTSMPGSSSRSSASTPGRLPSSFHAGTKTSVSGCSTTSRGCIELCERRPALGPHEADCAELTRQRAERRNSGGWTDFGAHAEAAVETAEEVADSQRV